VDSERCVFEDEALRKPSFSLGVHGARGPQSRAMRVPGGGGGRCAGLAAGLRGCLMFPILQPRSTRVPIPSRVRMTLMTPRCRAAVQVEEAPRDVGAHRALRAACSGVACWACWRCVVVGGTELPDLRRLSR
jgi:hypothetical protein